MRHLLAAAVIAVLLTGSGVASAQEVDLNSEASRAWWNGVTETELRELVAEAGGTWTDLPDTADVRFSRIDWPDLQGVGVRESNCPGADEPLKERNCGTMLLAVAVESPRDVQAFWLNPGGWLTLGLVDNAPALYRAEEHRFGTTRGHALSTIMLFRAQAIADIGRIARINGD